MNRKAIGIIDSGLGGLTVMREIIRKLPNEDIYYVGDTLHCPYGDKDPNLIIQYVKEITNYLLAKDIKLLIIACNTATVAALPILQNYLSIPVIGMIKAGSLAAVKQTKNQRIGVIATEGTINSHKYSLDIKKYNSGAVVFEKACQPFVQLVELGKTHTNEAKLIATNELLSFRTKQIDTLVLGCTHFPMMKDVIQEVLPTVALVDPAENVALETVKVLQQYQWENPKNSQGNYELIITKAEPMFAKLAASWLQVDFELKEVEIACELMEGT